MSRCRVCWLAIGLVVAIVAAQIAVWIQLAGFAPVGVFPLLFGTLVGGGVAMLARVWNEPLRGLVLAASLFAAIVCSAAEHGFFYLSYRNSFDAKLRSDPKVAMAAALNPENFEPASFSTYIRLEAEKNWLLWIFDVLAMIGSATASAWFFTMPSTARTAGPATGDGPVTLDP